MKQYKDILERIGEKLLKDGITNRKEWTSEIKKQFTKLARSERPEVTIATAESAIKNKDAGEWLYDLVWIKFDKNNHFMLSIELALESEWGNIDEIYEDFQKLLQSKSKIKIMIFQTASSDKCKSLFSDLHKWYNKYNPKLIGHEIYLAACWCNKEEQFEFLTIK